MKTVIELTRLNAKSNYQRLSLRRRYHKIADREAMYHSLSRSPYWDNNPTAYKMKVTHLYTFK